MDFKNYSSLCVYQNLVIDQNIVLKEYLFSNQDCEKTTDQKILVIIGLEYIFINSNIKTDCDTYFISPNIYIKDNIIIETKQPDTSQGRRIEQLTIKGINGKKGKRGYNTYFFYANIKHSNINYISIPGKGGKGQSGSPPGDIGSDGDPGKLYYHFHEFSNKCNCSICTNFEPCISADNFKNNYNSNKHIVDKIEFYDHNNNSIFFLKNYYSIMCHFHKKWKCVSDEYKKLFFL